MTADSAVRARPAALPPWRRRLALSQDALLVVVSAFFLWLHVQRVAEGSYTSVPFAIEQALLVGMFLFRRRSRATSTRPFDWVVAAGGWLPLLMRPHDAAFAAGVAGTAMQMAGLTMTAVGFLYLGRSFGVVAADRGLKVHGPYRFVRHPIYFSHFVTTIGFVAANFGLLNIGLLALVTVCQVLRIRAEERVLGETSDYAAYRAQVRWRLLPGLY